MSADLFCNLRSNWQSVVEMSLLTTEALVTVVKGLDGSSEDLRPPTLRGENDDLHCQIVLGVCRRQSQPPK